eukprot:g3739.t1
MCTQVNAYISTKLKMTSKAFPLKNKTIKMLWVNSSENVDNVWVKGRILDGPMTGSKLYKVEFHESSGNFIRLVNLGDKHLRPFWSILSSAEEDQQAIDKTIAALNAKISEEKEANWLQCDNQACNTWHELPTGLSADQFDDTFFTCKSVIWDKTVKACTIANGSSSSNNKDTNSTFSDSNISGLCAYEKKRLLNVQRNRIAFEALFPADGTLQSLFPTSSSSKRGGSTVISDIKDGGNAVERSRKRRKKAVVDGVDLSAFIDTRRSSRGQIQRTGIFEPCDFRNRKKRNPRRDCPVIFKGNLTKSNYKIEKGSDLVIEWEMEDPRTARGSYIYLAQKHGRVDDLYVICPEIDATTATKQTYTFKIPLHIPTGKDYFVEMANINPYCFGKSELFEVEDPVGFCLESDIGVWCCKCATTKHYIGKRGYKGNWLTCHICHSWQHEDCYSRKYTKKKDFICLFCHLDKQLFPDKQYFAATTAGSGALSTQNEKAKVSEEKKDNKNTRKMIETMLSMISQTARYRRKFTKLCSTPDHVALYFKKVLTDHGMAADKGQKIIDLGAGHGALTKILPTGSIAVEILENRFNKGKLRAPKSTWINADIFSSAFYDNVVKKSMNTYDYVISNPDFEVALQTIFISLLLLKKECKMYFLLPSDFFEASPPRTRVYKILNCTIEKEYKLGHLAFYEDNRNAQKLSTDSIFVLSRGRERKYEYTVINSRLAGMLRTSP